MKTFVKKSAQVTSFNNFQASALLLLRLIVGIAFLLHGWGKIQNPLSWMPPASGVPAFLQFLAAISEFGSGLALILGLLTRFAMLGLAFTMLIATAMHAAVMKDPFVNMAGGSSFEPALGYFGIAILFLAMGPGKYSLDKMIFGETK